MKKTLLQLLSAGAIGTGVLLGGCSDKYLENTVKRDEIEFVKTKTEDFAYITAMQPDERRYVYETKGREIYTTYEEKTIIHLTNNQKDSLEWKTRYVLTPDFRGEKLETLMRTNLIYTPKHKINKIDKKTEQDYKKDVLKKLKKEAFEINGRRFAVKPAPNIKKNTIDLYYIELDDNFILEIDNETGYVYIGNKKGLLRPYLVDETKQFNENNTNYKEINFKEHTVIKGENLSTIAKEYSVTVNEILQINNIKDKNLIYTGTKIKIPRK